MGSYKKFELFVLLYWKNLSLKWKIVPNLYHFSRFGWCHILVWDLKSINSFKITFIKLKWIVKYMAFSQEILKENHALLLQSAGSWEKNDALVIDIKIQFSYLTGNYICSFHSPADMEFCIILLRAYIRNASAKFLQVLLI